MKFHLTQPTEDKTIYHIPTQLSPPLQLEAKEKNPGFLLGLIEKIKIVIMEIYPVQRNW